MKKGSNRLRLIFVVVLITLIITAFGFFSEGLTQLPTQNQFSVTRTVEFDGGSYKVTLAITPTAATDDIVISDSVSGGVIDQNSISFTNFKNYQTFNPCSNCSLVPIRRSTKQHNQSYLCC